MKRRRLAWAVVLGFLLISQAAFGAGWRQGRMLSNTMTPDGYEGNPDGAWLEDGTVTTRIREEDSTEENSTEENSAGGEDMLTVTIQVGSREFEAKLYDNETARELVSRLPMTISMEELNGNEKYYYLPESLPADTQEIGSIHEGDLMLFGSDCLVLFYKDFQTTYRYTRLGIVEDPTGLSEALGQGGVTVTFRLINHISSPQR